MATAKEPRITSIKTIEAALKLVDAKKESLKRSFDDLQAYSFLLTSSFSSSLSWSDIDSHFSSLYDQLTHRFHLLGQQQQKQPPPLSQNRLDSADTRDEVRGESSQSRAEENYLNYPSFEEPSQDGVDAEVSRSELLSFCEKMDGIGLRNYIAECRRVERNEIRVDLVGAMRMAPDPGAMVLDAMEGFYPQNVNDKGDNDTDLFRLRKGCLEMLEALVEIKPNLRGEVREKAKMLALEWKGKVILRGENTSEPLGLLNLVAAFQLENEFNMAEFVDYFFFVARFKQAPALCRAISLGDKTADLIQKLIDSGKLLLAVKFIFECGMTEKFQAVPLLKTHLKECKMFAAKVSSDGKSSPKQKVEAISREVNALRSVIQIIKEHKLDSEFPLLDLENRVEILEKQKTNMKISTPSSNNRPQQQLQKQQPKQPKKQQQQNYPKQQVKKQKQRQKPPQQLNGNRHARTSGPPGPAEVPINITGSSSMGPPFQQSYSQAAARPYGFVGSAPPIAHYAAPPVGPYGLAGHATGFYGNPGAATAAHPYAHESYVPSGYYDGRAGYSAYGVPPQYHPAYYPQ